MKTQQAIKSVLFGGFFMLALSCFNATSAQVRKRVVHHKIEKRIDRREDIRDRREDKRDHRKDVRERREVKHDRREDRRDRRH